jgi:hypothetical protein
MVETSEQLREVVNAQLDRIRIPEVAVFLRQHLVPPAVQYLRWGYSREPVSYPCWLVADLACRGIFIVYSEYGHGKHDPWGAVNVADGMYGMDDRWFLTIEDAVINSGCWAGPIPDDYEIG